MTQHPRLMLTQSMLNTMITNGWNTNSNPYWKNGLSINAASAVAEVDAKWCFSFGGNCTATAQGQPVHVYDGTLYNGATITAISRDGTGHVTLTFSTAMNLWVGAQIDVVPTTTSSFPSGTFAITAINSPTSVTYAQAGAMTSSTGGTVGFTCNTATSTTNPTTWCDFGGYKSPIDATEQYTELFAFMSLLTTGTTSQNYAIRSHDMFMWMMNKANLNNPLTAQNCSSSIKTDFQNCAFPIHDRAHQIGFESFPLTVDWLYSHWTTADKATIRTVFRAWSNIAFTSAPTGGSRGNALYPYPFATVNNTSLISNRIGQRWMFNNYGSSEYRSVSMMGLSLDPLDDVPDDGNEANWNAGIAYDSTALVLSTNSLRGYYYLSQGAWNYKKWAFFEDPGITSSVLGTTAAGLGEGFGGLTAEGSEYGPNSGYNAMAAFSFHTAGVDDPTNMPQLSFMSSSQWDLWIDGILNSMSPTAYYTNTNTGWIWDTSEFGDTATETGITVDWIKLLLPLGLYDYYTGNNPNQLNAIRWIVKYGMWGGCGYTGGSPLSCGTDSSFLYKRLHGSVGSGFSAPILFFMLLDPNAPSSVAGDTDPRPNYPTEFYATGWHRLHSRTDWSANASWLSTICTFNTIDHQAGDCGQTELYRKGKWITKAHATYVNNYGAATEFYNAGISIQNPSTNPVQTGRIDIQEARGSQINYTNDTPPVLTASDSTYVFQYMESTGHYNNNNGAYQTNAVVAASRSLLWLKPDVLVVYDRGTSQASGFKNVGWNFTSSPVITGNTAVATDATSGQQSFVKALLPAGGNLALSTCQYTTANGDCTGTDFQASPFELSQYLLKLLDVTNPISTQFLSVVEGADSGATATPSTLIQSSSGTAFDGAELDGSVNTAVMFIRDPATLTSFTTMTYSVPSTVATHYVSGLQPNTAYTVSKTAASGQVTVVVTSTPGAAITDTAGVLKF